MHGMDWGFDNTFARELDWLGAAVDPLPVAAPTLLTVNDSLALELGLDPQWLASTDGVAHLAGNAVPEGAQPWAQAYAGHQFGQFSPLLGDGRAHLLGEVVDAHGARRDLGLKGSGRTPFSRGGDGRAALGPVLRELIVSEAMHALGIPTTRVLAAVATGEQILRADGPTPGAVLTRVASSHLRVGTAELVRMRASDAQQLAFADYVRRRHHPQVAEGDHLGLIDAVVEAQASLIARWMSVGFIHGVMNTDNMTLSGETIDYGPCAFLEAHDPNAVFSSIDTMGRYRFGAQPSIAQWNLARYAETLLPLQAPDPSTESDLIEAATERIRAFETRFRGHWLRLHRGKLGLPDALSDTATAALTDDLLVKIVSYITDPVTTTDELIPSGETSSFRSNPLRLAEFTLSRKDPAYVPNAKAVKALDEERRAGALPAEIARVYDDLKKLGYAPDAANTNIGSAIFANKPGDGSAREQAASCQRVLGGAANFACEYATKRYRSNCINWGMLPFLVENPGALDNGDYVYLPGVRKALLEAADELDAVAVKPNGGLVKFTVKLGAMTDAERRILADGCLINYYKNN